MNDVNLPIINALWIGGNLGAISRCCLNSFLMRGHIVNLFAYHPINDVPDGINVCDANQIIPSSKIFKHQKKQSYAPFSDIFSYQLLQKLNGQIYVDCDVYCLKPIEIPHHGYLYGYESENLINVAILSMPSTSQLLKDLNSIYLTPNFVPEWYSSFRKIKLSIKRIFGQARDLSQMNWGITGPSALTYYAKKNGVDILAQPLDVLYPIQYSTVSKLTDTQYTINDIITQRSVCVHLYNEVIKNLDLKKLDESCILSQMLENKI